MNDVVRLSPSLRTSRMHKDNESRGVHMHGTDMVTSRMLGCFSDNPMTRQEFMSMVHSNVDE
jgi:GTP cyclohydrolase I